LGFEIVSSSSTPDPPESSGGHARLPLMQTGKSLVSKGNIFQEVSCAPNYRKIIFIFDGIFFF
jgi:hypothetical protein